MAYDCRDDDDSALSSLITPKHKGRSGKKLIPNLRDDDRGFSPTTFMSPFMSKSKKDRVTSKSPEKSRRGNVFDRRTKQLYGSHSLDYGNNKNSRKSNRTEYDDRRHHHHSDIYNDERQDKNTGYHNHRQKKSYHKKRIEGVRSISPSRWSGDDNYLSETTTKTAPSLQKTSRTGKIIPKEKINMKLIPRHLSPISKEFNNKKFQSTFACSPTYRIDHNLPNIFPTPNANSSPKKKYGFSFSFKKDQKEANSKKTGKSENKGRRAKKSPNSVQLTKGSSKSLSKSSSTKRSFRHTDELPMKRSHMPHSESEETFEEAINTTKFIADGMHMKRSHTTYSESEETTSTMNCDKDDYVNAEISYSKFGKAQNVMKYLGYLDSPVPKNENSVIIKVEASSVSFTDVLIRKNLWNVAVALPNIPGVDCVGRIFSTGSSAGNYGLKEGDRVVALSPYLQGNSRYVSTDANKVVKIINEFDAAEAACIVRSYLIAYQCLHRAGEKGIQRGDTVLVIGGNGAVAQAVIQLAVVAGASKVFATVHNKFRNMIHKLGGIALPREPEDWFPEIKGQIDIVIDGVCSNGFSTSRATLRGKNSKLVCIGTAAKYSTEQIFSGVPVAAMWQATQATWLMSQTTFFDVFRFNDEHNNIFKKDLLYLFQLLQDGCIRPNVEKRISLKAVPDAHELIEAGGLSGQTVCIPWLGVLNSTNSQTKSTEKQMFRGWSKSPIRKKKLRSRNIKTASHREARGWSEAPDKNIHPSPVSWKVSEFVQKNYKANDGDIYKENNKVKKNDDKRPRRRRWSDSHQRRNEEIPRGDDLEEKEEKLVRSSRQNRRLETEIQVTKDDKSPRRRSQSDNHPKRHDGILRSVATDKKERNTILSGRRNRQADSEMQVLADVSTLSSSESSSENESEISCFSDETSSKNDTTLGTKVTFDTIDTIVTSEDGVFTINFS